MRRRSAAIRAGNRRMEWDGGAVGQGDRFGVPVWRDEARPLLREQKNKEGYDLQGRGKCYILVSGAWNSAEKSVKNIADAVCLSFSGIFHT